MTSINFSSQNPRTLPTKSNNDSKFLPPKDSGGISQAKILDNLDNHKYPDSKNQKHPIDNLNTPKKDNMSYLYNNDNKLDSKLNTLEGALTPSSIKQTPRSNQNQKTNSMETELKKQFLSRNQSTKGAYNRKLFSEEPEQEKFITQLKISNLKNSDTIEDKGPKINDCNNGDFKLSSILTNSCETQNLGNSQNIYVGIMSKNPRYNHFYQIESDRKKNQGPSQGNHYQSHSNFFNVKGACNDNIERSNEKRLKVADKDITFNNSFNNIDKYSGMEIADQKSRVLNEGNMQNMRSLDDISENFDIRAKMMNRFLYSSNSTTNLANQTCDLNENHSKLYKSSATGDMNLVSDYTSDNNRETDQKVQYQQKIEMKLIDDNNDMIRNSINNNNIFDLLNRKSNIYMSAPNKLQKTDLTCDKVLTNNFKIDENRDSAKLDKTEIVEVVNNSATKCVGIKKCNYKSIGNYCKKLDSMQKFTNYFNDRKCAQEINNEASSNLRPNEDEIQVKGDIVKAQILSQKCQSKSSQLQHQQKKFPPNTNSKNNFVKDLKEHAAQGQQISRLKIQDLSSKELENSDKLYIHGSGFLLESNTNHNSNIDNRLKKTISNNTKTQLDSFAEFKKTRSKGQIHQFQNFQVSQNTQSLNRNGSNINKTERSNTVECDIRSELLQQKKVLEEERQARGSLEKRFNELQKKNEQQGSSGKGSKYYQKAFEKNHKDDDRRQSASPFNLKNMNLEDLQNLTFGIHFEILQRIQSQFKEDLLSNSSDEKHLEKVLQMEDEQDQPQTPDNYKKIRSHNTNRVEKSYERDRTNQISMKDGFRDYGGFMNDPANGNLQRMENDMNKLKRLLKRSLKR